MIWPLVAAATFVGGPPGPDGRITVPGVINPAISQVNIATTICVSGWTKTVRPPVAYTNKLKFALMDKAGIPRGQAKQYELDHAIPIEDGGHPSDLNNLSLQPYFGPHNAHIKDAEETATKRAICNGSLTLLEGQEKIQRDWLSLPGKAP